MMITFRLWRFSRVCVNGECANLPRFYSEAKKCPVVEFPCFYSEIWEALFSSLQFKLKSSSLAWLSLQRCQSNKMHDHWRRVCVCVCWCISHQCRSSLPSPFPESTTDSLESNCESAVWVKPISSAAASLCSVNGLGRSARSHLWRYSQPAGPEEPPGL